MINLINKNHSIEIVLSGAVTTNELDYFTSFAQVNALLGNSYGNTNGTTAVSMLQSDGSNTAKSINYICVFNKDTASATVTIRINIDGVQIFTIHSATLNVGQKLEFIGGNGWVVS